MSRDKSTWTEVLAERGHALIPKFLSIATCKRLRDGYADDARFRGTVIMQRHGFGQGEYRYFDYPLPPLVAELRREMYGRLQPVANLWQKCLGLSERYPPVFDEFLDRCHESGQSRPTALMLKYGIGDYNRSHQDSYGEVQFPLQVAVLLSNADREFCGGEFVLSEQTPRKQTRISVVPLAMGDAVVFAGNVYPGIGPRGFHRRTQRHAVSEVRDGERYCLGLIFHDGQ